jgi:hypothetical protein
MMFRCNRLFKIIIISFSLKGGGISIMDLIDKYIPYAFLKTLPEGMKFISKEGEEFLVVEKLLCPHGHNLITNEVHIHGEPTIRLNIKSNNTDGIFYLDTYWGYHTKLYNFMPKYYDEVEIIDICCPKCKKSLIIEKSCQLEESSSNKMIQLQLSGKNNRILACAKFSCPENKLEISNICSSVTQKISEINFFGISFDDDVFKGV